MTQYVIRISSAEEPYFFVDEHSQPRNKRNKPIFVSTNKAKCELLADLLNAAVAAFRDKIANE
jgi:hypothetical protein